MMYLSAGGTTTVLPNALPDDTVNNIVNSNLRRSMNNVPYTYVKTSGNLRLVYKFLLFRPKALELQAFIDAYVMYPITIINYRGDVYIGTLLSEPMDYATVAREEMTEVTLEFEVVQTVQVVSNC